MITVRASVCGSAPFMTQCAPTLLGHELLDKLTHSVHIVGGKKSDTWRLMKAVNNVIIECTLPLCEQGMHANEVHEVILSPLVWSGSIMGTCFVRLWAPVASSSAMANATCVVCESTQDRNASGVHELEAVPARRCCKLQPEPICKVVPACVELHWSLRGRVSFSVDKLMLISVATFTSYYDNSMLSCETTLPAACHPNVTIPCEVVVTHTQVFGKSKLHNEVHCILRPRVLLTPGVYCAQLAEETKGAPIYFFEVRWCDNDTAAKEDNNSSTMAKRSSARYVRAAHWCTITQRAHM